MACTLSKHAARVNNFISLRNGSSAPNRTQAIYLCGSCVPRVPRPSLRSTCSCPIDTAAANHSNQPVGSSKSDMRLSIWGPSFPPPRDRPARAIQTRNPGVSGCLRSQDGCVWVCRGGSHLCTVPSRIGAEHYLTRRGAFGPKPHFLGGGSYVQWPARSDITAVFYALACSRI